MQTAIKLEKKRLTDSDTKRLRLLLKDCANGFYQQMYFLGKDVIHPQGNQLKQYGFEKSASKGLKGTSCYTYQSDDTIIELYGSCTGLYTADTQLVFLRKKCKFYTWLPEHRLVAGCWSQDDLQTEDPYKMLTALKPFLKWWCDYEKWIEKRMGLDYRKKCFNDWTKVQGSVAWLPPTMALKWVQQFLEKKELHLRPKHFS